MIEIGTSLLLFIPFVGFAYPIVSIGTKVLYGVKGTEWSWKNKRWSSRQEFERNHDIWNKVGLGLFIFNIVVIPVLAVAFYATLVSALF